MSTNWRCLARSSALALLLSAVACTTPESLRIVAVTEGDSTDAGSYYRFPLLRGGEPKATSYVNSQLTEAVLSVKPDDVEESLFEKVRATEDFPIPTLANVNYRIERFNEFGLSVTIVAEGCGAYCEYWERTFNFLLETGEWLPAPTFLKFDGNARLLRVVEAEVQQTIQQELNRLKTLSADQRTDEFETLENYQLALEMYEGCLSSAEYVNYAGMQFAVLSDSFRITVPRCSNHAMRALDAVGDFVVEVPISDWEDFISDYGRRFLYGRQFVDKAAE